MKKTGAVLVAAGLSSRMKSFKPMLPFAGTTISRHIIATLQSMGINPIIVITGYRREELEQHLSSDKVCFIRNDRFRETQMFDSVKMGIGAIPEECEHIMIMPIDVPAIRTDTFRQVLNVDSEIVRTVYHGEPGHPIIIRSRVAEVLCRYTGVRGLRGAIEESRIAVTDIEVEDEEVCRDVDTAEDYQKLLERSIKSG